MVAEAADGTTGARLPTLDLRKVKDRLQVNNAQPMPSNKSNIFSPRSSLHRVPLSSRRNTNNFASPASSAGPKLPQAAAANTQQQLLQQNTAGLYSPRISNGFSTQRSNFGTSPRGTLRGSRKEHASQMPPGNLQQSSLAAGSSFSTAAQQAAHAAAAAKRLSLGQLKQFQQQQQQQQQQLFSPRQDRSAAKGALTARANLQNTFESLTSAKLAQHDNGSWTWRAQHAQQAPVQAVPAQQPVQPLPSTHSPTRAHVQSITTPLQEPPSVSGTAPLTPSQTLQAHSSSLTGFEQSEILQFSEIYFWGLPAARKHEGTPHLSDLNHGYDDEHGDYRMVLGDHMGYRFEILGRLGKGSFGQVLKCRDHKTGELVALKVIRNQKRFHKQAQVEVKILEHLRAQDSEGRCHVVQMREAVPFRNHLCISFELLSINLYDYIKANSFKGSSLRLIRKFATQVLVCLRYLRHQKVLHCDLKPENILLKEGGRSGIKVIDFGSSCFEGEQVYSYIQSRFYRSPEVMLGLRYGPAIDMWSLACILAELYTGYPLFPGENEAEQMQCVMEIAGLPPAELLQKASRRDHFFEADGTPRLTPNKAGLRRFPGSKELTQALGSCDTHFISFLQACLRWDPKERLTPEEALQHAWTQSVDLPPMPAPAQPLAPVVAPGWSPRDNPTSTSWLSRLQPEPSGAKLGNSSGSNTSRYMKDKMEGVSLIPPLHSSGAVTQRGTKASAWLLQPRRHQ